jgi:phosphinothricin acetyltransferase
MFIIREARKDDTGKIREIYAPYIIDTAITFRDELSDFEENKNEIEELRKSHAYLVAEEENEILGYAYAAPVRSQEAYAHSVETSIYLRPEAKGKNIGRKLYEELFKRLKAKGYSNLYAVIAVSDVKDSFLPEGSVPFHKALGFEIVGRLNNCGKKFGHFYSVVWMEKII